MENTEDHRKKYEEHQDAEWKRLPTKTKELAVSKLKEVLPQNFINEINEVYKIHGKEWFHNMEGDGPFHFRQGMAIRNKLRNLGIKDDMTPSGNLDDYYIQILEAVCGHRSL